MSKQNTDIVITQFNESLDWLKDFDHTNIRYIWVYSKGKEIFYGHELNKKIIHQYYPNYGREALTNLYHVVRHYDNLPENILFTQSNVNPHFNINNVWRDDLDTNVIITDLVNYIQNNEFTNNYQLTEIWDILTHDGTNGGCEEWWRHGKCPNLKHCLKGLNPDCYVHLKGYVDDPIYTHNLTRADLQLFEWVKERLKVDTTLVFPHTIVPVFWGCILGIKSKYIITRSKTFYQEIIDNDLNNVFHPEYTHYIERTWYYIFNIYLTHRFSKEQIYR